MGKIVFNKYYALKPDEGKVLILSTYPGRNIIKGLDDSFTSIIHPIYAMILSFIDNRTYDECISEAACELGVTEGLVRNFIDILLDNPEKTYLKSKEGISMFPPHTIVSNQSGDIKKRYNADKFSYDCIDLRMTRHKTPSTITFMVNNICITDCIYCYQDKSKKAGCGIPLERMLALIHEAHRLNVNSIDVIGGEFFLYPYWKEVLSELRKYGYNPYLSTKMPLSEEDIRFLADLKIHDIQISLDSLIEEHLIHSIKVKKGYAKGMLDSIRSLDSHGIPVLVHSVLTRYNDSIEDMHSLYSALKDIKNLKVWHVVKGDASLYPRVPYSEIEISPEALNNIVEYLETLREESHMTIKTPERILAALPSENKTGDDSADSEIDTEGKFRNAAQEFFSRSFCSGLYSSLYVLPDGNVTMCEQLYWNKHFIVGNVLTQSIEEIWNSEKATNLFFIKQEDIPEDSLCHSCASFKACRNLRQVCYREIIRNNGMDKWYYPDPKCPFLIKQDKKQP